jgi:mitochondrial fission protein ELM1
MDRIAQRYGEYEIAVTTSPRTSGEIEALVSSYGFDYEVIHSRDRINPIPDMLEQCERVFVTADSTSMISEAVSHGRCHVVVLPTGAAGENKLARMTESLRREGYLTLFGEEASGAPRKIDFALYARKVQA